MEFKRLELKDIETIKPFIVHNRNRIADASLGGIMLWRDYLETGYTIENDTLFLQYTINYCGNQTAYAVPLGRDFTASVGLIRSHCQQCGIPAIICDVAQPDVEILEQLFGVESVVCDRAWSDYVYNAQDLITLAGKKYNGQRNHIHRFIREFGDRYRFEPIGESNMNATRQFLEDYFQQRSMTGNLENEDKAKVWELIDHYQDYGFYSGAIVIDDKIVAVSFGEIMNDTLYVHVEKADTSIPGSYQIITNAFAKQYAGEGILYINREDDAGSEGLRKAKLAYHPAYLLDKHLVTLK